LRSFSVPVAFRVSENAPSRPRSWYSSLVRTTLGWPRPRSGFLVLRVVREPHYPPGLVWAELSRCEDLLESEQQDVTVATREDVLRLVGDWLDGFLTRPDVDR